jgi:hypothetical protein
MLFNPSSQSQVSQQPQFSNSATVTDFALSATVSQVAPDRSTLRNRRGLIVFNDGTAAALFSYGTTISPTTFTAEILPGGYLQDSFAAPWQGPAVMRSSTNAPTSVNVTELVLI